MQNMFSKRTRKLNHTADSNTATPTDSIKSKIQKRK